MPVLLTRLEPYDVAGTDLLDRASLALRTSEAEGDDERLTQWMCVPCRARARLEGDRGAGRAPGRRRREERIDANGAGEPVVWALRRGLRAAARDPHRIVSESRPLRDEKRAPLSVYVGIRRAARTADGFFDASTIAAARRAGAQDVRHHPPARAH